MPGAPHGSDDAFVTKLGPTGALLFSTALGGSDTDIGYAIAVDHSGDAYVTGQTNSSDFPTLHALQPSFHGPHSAFSSDVFVTELAGSGKLLYSTYLGGSGSDGGYGIAVDPSGDAYVTGQTGSSDFPTINALQSSIHSNINAFVAELTTGGATLAYSTYLGGSRVDYGNAIAVDASGDAFVTGDASSSNFPTVNAFQSSRGSGNFNAFVAELSSGGGTLDYSTYLGGNGSAGDTGAGIAVDSSGDAYVTGQTSSSDFPTTSGAYRSSLSGSSDAFVTKFNPFVSTSPTISGLSPTVAEGQASFTLTVSGTNFDGTATVLWNGSPLTTHFTSATQVEAFVPAALVAEEGTATVAVAEDNGTSRTATFPITDAPLTLTAFHVPSGQTQGQATGSFTVAAFTDGNSGASVSDFTATVSWGDGSNTTASVVALSGTSFIVVGSHTYSQAGILPFAVSVADVGGSSLSASGTAIVGPASSSSSPSTSSSSSSSSSGGTGTFHDRVWLDALLVADGMFIGNAFRVGLGLGDYLIFTGGLPGSLQASLQTEFLTDVGIDLFLLELTNPPPA